MSKRQAGTAAESEQAAKVAHTGEKYVLSAAAHFACMAAWNGADALCPNPCCQPRVVGVAMHGQHGFDVSVDADGDNSDSETEERCSPTEAAAERVRVLAASRYIVTRAQSAVTGSAATTPLPPRHIFGCTHDVGRALFRGDKTHGFLYDGHWAHSLVQRVDTECTFLRDDVVPYILFVVAWLTGRIETPTAGDDKPHFVDRLNSFLAMHANAMQLWQEWLGLGRELDDVKCAAERREEDHWEAERAKYREDAEAHDAER